jgi:hypothetical protein
MQPKMHEMTKRSTMRCRASVCTGKCAKKSKIKRVADIAAALVTH